MAVEQIASPLPVGKILRGWGGDFRVKYPGAYPLMVSTLSGAQLEDTEKCPPSQRYWVGGWVKKPSRIPSQWKGTGGALTRENEGIPETQLKNTEVTPL